MLYKTDKDCWSSLGPGLDKLEPNFELNYVYLGLFSAVLKQSWANKVKQDLAVQRDNQF